MADKKFSELETASEIKNGDFLALSQDTGNGKVSLKATILALATKMLTAINFTSALTTTDKTVLGAINEVAQGGGGGGTDVIAEDFDSTATYAVGDYCIYGDSLYKCTTAVTTAGDWDSSDWTETLVMDEVEQGGGGTGGHIIIDENGNSMSARAGLQFVGGANVSDDSTNNRTIVDISGGGGGFGLVQSGHTVYTLTGRNLEDRVYITFDTPFPEVPNVALSLSDPSRGQSYNPQTGLGVMNVTKNGFDILIKSSSNAVAGEIIIYWIATAKMTGAVDGVFIDANNVIETLVGNGDMKTYTATEDCIVAGTIVGTSGNTPALLVDDVTVVYTSQNMTIGACVCLKKGQVLGYCMASSGTNLKVYGVQSGTRLMQHNYSTEEHIVGTWIDGSPIYEKTFDLGSDLIVAYNNWTELGITLDANKIISSQATATVGSFQGNILVYYDSIANKWKGQSPRNTDGSWVRYLTLQYTKASS